MFEGTAVLEVIGDTGRAQRVVADFGFNAGLPRAPLDSSGKRLTIASVEYRNSSFAAGVNTPEPGPLL